MLVLLLSACILGEAPYTDHVDLAVTATYDALVVDSDAGEVVVHTARGTPSARLTWHDDDRPDVTAEVVDRTLIVTVDCPEGAFECAASLDLPVPMDTDVLVGVGVGRVTVKGVNGPSIEVGTGVGDVTVDGRAPRIVLASGTGDVEVRDRIAPAWLTADTGVGSVLVEVPAGSYECEATTGLGTVEIEGIVDVPKGAHVLHATSGLGDVTVRGL